MAMFLPSAQRSTSTRRLQKEAAEMMTSPPPNCSGGPKGGNLFEWTASIEGPAESAYEGGHFLLELRFPSDYPFRPPKVIFKTRIYHCNINSQGVVCLDLLQDQWTPALNVGKLLLSLTLLLSNCNPNDPLVGSIAKQYRTDKEKHDDTAKLWTQRYAK
ncbi:ubiquitin-conjugating enzyme E2 E3-like [Halichondria panicea]|uniref:ubiquitin-conjugating enzyme E2 E3-like n=1 Tax=Halichondria panicea TaxID=6063 RepID=UPI00312B6AF4